MREFRIAVLPGDGIGREVMSPCLALLDIAVARAGGFRLTFDQHEAGADLYRRTGVAHAGRRRCARRSRRMRFCSARWGCPSVRYPDGTEVQPHLDLRERFDLYAGVRPFRLFKGAPDAARRSARDRHRLRAGARIHRRPVRVADDDPPRGERRRVRHDADHSRDVASVSSRSRLRWPARGRERERPPGPRDLRRQGERDSVDGVSSDRSFSNRVAPSRHRVRLRLRGCGRAQAGAGPVGVRRPRHREHVRRHPVGCRGAGSSAEWAWRRRPISATAMACSSRATGQRPISPAAVWPIRRP